MVSIHHTICHQGYTVRFPTISNDNADNYIQLHQDHYQKNTQEV